MVNLNTVLNDRIARIARKEIKNQTAATKKATGRYRGDIASLKRQVEQLTRQLAILQKQLGPQAAPEPSELPAGARFSARSVKAQRARLGLSAREFGQLLSVAPLTVYAWESGKSRPRAAQFARLVAIRDIGRREALRRLGVTTGEEEGAASPAPRRRARGSYAQTAEQFILSLVKGSKANTTAEINAAWRKIGRPGKADNTITRMVKAGALKRGKLKGERGSSYSA